jgi:hypothetical protein
MVIFAPQNLIMDPPFTKLDLLSCRNLLIYLAPEMQKKLFPLFHYSLNPGGILFLGSAETVGTFTDLFTPLNGKAAPLSAPESALRRSRSSFPRPLRRPCRGRQPNQPPAKPPLQFPIWRTSWSCNGYAPPAVLVNDKGDILYVSGRTGKYLEPAAGKANWNIFAMAREGCATNSPALSQSAPAERTW